MAFAAHTATEDHRAAEVVGRKAVAHRVAVAVAAAGRRIDQKAVVAVVAVAAVAAGGKHNFQELQAVGQPFAAVWQSLPSCYWVLRGRRVPILALRLRESMLAYPSAILTS